MQVTAASFYLHTFHSRARVKATILTTFVTAASAVRRPVSGAGATDRGETGAPGRNALTDPSSRRRRRRTGPVFFITRAGRLLFTWAPPAQVCVYRGLRRLNLASVRDFLTVFYLFLLA